MAMSMAWPTRWRLCLATCRPFCSQKRVVGRGTVAGDDVNLVSSPKLLVDQVEILYGIDIHDGYLVGVVAPHDPVYGMQGVKVIRSIRPPEVNGESIVCVVVEKCKCPGVGKKWFCECCPAAAKGRCTCHCHVKKCPSGDFFRKQAEYSVFSIPPYHCIKTVYFLPVYRQPCQLNYL